MSSACDIDHLVLGAHTLEQGADYIEHRFGARPQPGGKHVAMGTHNMLLKLGAKSYLEVIAIDPEGTTPQWFYPAPAGIAPTLALVGLDQTLPLAAANRSQLIATIRSPSRTLLHPEIALTAGCEAATSVRARVGEPKGMKVGTGAQSLRLTKQDVRVFSPPIARAAK